MTSPDVRTEITAAVDAYRADANMAHLLERIEHVARAADPDILASAVEPFRAMPEVAGPAYEHIVAAKPDDARALVILPNAYSLAGRGPEQVAELASRAIAADPPHRGGWHLWALTESALRSRVAAGDRSRTAFRRTSSLSRTWLTTPPLLPRPTTIVRHWTWRSRPIRNCVPSPSVG